jgi:hypothetical protein
MGWIGANRIFDSVRAMKSLHSKVLMRITALSILKE